jgi:perosamine synthetase
MREEDPKKIPITKPQVGKAESDALALVIESGWLVQGPMVAEFERLVAEFTDAGHAIATSSCTTALHTALVAAGIGPGDAVVIPSFTYVATANVVEYTGAMPLFADIDPVTFTVDPMAVRHTLEQKRYPSGLAPKAIIPVSLFGLCAVMPALNEIAEEFDLIVIEDAACGVGAFRDGHHAGTEAVAGAFSFHPRKSITTGEGGMVITDDTTLAATVRQLRDHGASRTDLERHMQSGGSLLPDFNILGYNYRMTDLQGAIGVEQMKRCGEIIEARRKIATDYKRALADVEGICPPAEPPGYIHAFQSFVCWFGVDPVDIRRMAAEEPRRIEHLNVERNRIMARLEEAGIMVRQGTHAVHTLGYYRTKYGLKERDCPVSFAADRLSLSLPLYGQIDAADRDRVVETLRAYVNPTIRSV